MLVTGTQLVGTPIMSLQTGTKLGTAETAIINPSNLKIVAFEVEGQNLDLHPSLLLVSDVRELSDMGMIINSSEEFVGEDDIIKLKPLYELKFDLIHKHVVDDRKHKIGKIIDYTIDPESFVIQQLCVKRPLLKSLSEAELLVHRSQIVEINDTQVIIKSGVNKKPSVANATASTLDYVNPFRQNAPHAEGTEVNEKS